MYVSEDELHLGFKKLKTLSGEDVASVAIMILSAENIYAEIDDSEFALATELRGLIGAALALAVEDKAGFVSAMSDDEVRKLMARMSEHVEQAVDEAEHRMTEIFDDNEGSYRPREAPRGPAQVISLDDFRRSR